MSHRIGAAALAAAFALPLQAQQGDPGMMMPETRKEASGRPATDAPRAEANAQDRLFVQLFGAGGHAEVALGRLADGKAGTDGVRAFARRMVEDHGKANQELAGLARDAGIPLAQAPLPEHEATEARLKALDGPRFDDAYLRAQLVEHQKAVQLLEWEIGQGQHAGLQRFAAATLPVVMSHLAAVQKLIAHGTGAPPQGLAAADFARQHP